MGFGFWANAKLKNLRWFDISLVKLSSFLFALFIAKLWPELLGLDWYWYLIIALVAAVVPMYHMFKE
jgi:hypothetical protein